MNSSETGRGLIVHFPDFAYLDNACQFQNAGEAAEVSLWLLGSFNPKSEFTQPNSELSPAAQSSE